MRARAATVGIPSQAEGGRPRGRGRGSSRGSARTADPGSAGRARSGPGSSALIAVVDDEPDIVSSLERLFRVATSHRVVPFTSGTSFLGWLDHNRPDAVILDLAMPSPNGPEILRQLRSGPFVDVPVLVITGSGEDLVDQAVAAGATAVLMKPFDFDDLAARLEAALRAR